MKLFELYKKSFSNVVANPTITMFLVLFLILSNLMAVYMFSSKTVIVATILSFCLFMLTLSFISGWLYIVKEISIEGEKENKNYFSVFLEGIGKNIIPVGIGSFIYTLLLVLVLLITGKIAFLLFGSLDFIAKDITVLTQDTNQFIQHLEKLNDNQKYILYSWQLCFIFASAVFNFILLYYFPSIIYNEKNIFLRAFSALWIAIKFLFKNFFSSLFVYLTIYLTYFALSILKFFFMQNTIISILILFFYIYFICGAVMLIFNYYGQKNNCNNRCDSIRENETIDRVSKEN